MAAGFSTYARELAESFEWKTRTDPLLHERPDDPAGQFVSLRDSSPEWAQDVVREAHGGMMPDDWRYLFVKEAAEWIAEEVEAWDGEVDPDDLDTHEFADSTTDVYTGELTAWLASSNERQQYLDEAVQELGARENILQVAKYCERLEVCGLVIQELTRLVEEEEDDEEEVTA
mgnify:CR=1 FL=1